MLTRSIQSDIILQDIISKAQIHNLPVISIDRPLNGCYSIQFDERHAFEQIIRHIIEEHHCRRINFLAGIRNNPDSELRLQVYRKILTEYQIPIEEERIAYGDFWPDPSKRAVQGFLDSDLPLPEAIVCSNDTMAIAAYEQLTDNGLRVPDDILITGYDGIAQALEHVPSITTSQYAYDDAVVRAFEILTACFAGQPVSKQHLLANTFLPGSSCGCQHDVSQGHDKPMRKLYARLHKAQYFGYLLIEMTANLADSESFQDLFSTLMNYAENFQSPAFWLCIVDNFLTEEELSDIIEQSSFHHNGYSDHMDIMLSCIENVWQGITDFPTLELLPRLSVFLEKYNNIMFLPLHVLDQTIGYVALAYDPGRFEMYYAYQFAMNVSNALEITKTHRRQQNIISSLENKYIHDPMTGMLNRRGFYQKMTPMFENNLDSGKQLMIVSVDLNGLKPINDTYGHSDGDFAISTVAKALSKALTPTQVCARFGGDEFIVAGLLDNPDGIEIFRDNFHSILDEYNAQSDKPYEISASIGAISCHPDKTLPLDELIKIADEEMYKEKVLYHQQAQRQHVALQKR